MRTVSLSPSSYLLYGCDLKDGETGNEAKFISFFAAAGMLVVMSLPTFARPSHPPQDQPTSQTQSVQNGGEKQKAEPGSGKEIGKGGEEIWQRRRQRG